MHSRVALLVVSLFVALVAGLSDESTPNLLPTNTLSEVAGDVDRPAQIGAEDDPPLARAGGSGSPGPILADGWWSQVQEGIAAMEYRVTPVGADLQAPNRANAFRTWFRSDGIEVVPRTPGAGSWSWTWRTEGIGRGTNDFSPEPRVPVGQGVRTEYRHDGWVEWYVNGPNGLEQGFTVERRLAGEGPLCIRGTTGGELAPDPLGPESARRGIAYRDPSGHEVLRYSNLLAFDATGRELQACLLTEENDVRITVDDAGAAYPLTIDPNLYDPSWTHEGGQANAYLGYTASTAGDVNSDGYSEIAIAATGYDSGQTDEGAVFVFYGASGGPSTAPDWTFECNSANAGMNMGVCTAGDVNGDGFDDLVIGSPAFNNGINRGRVWVFHGAASGLSTHAWTKTGESASVGSFGRSVSTAGDINGDGYDEVIIGDRSWTGDQSLEGRAWVYFGSASGLATTAAWIRDGNQINAYFGFSVASAGDVNADGYADVIVGAYNYDGAFVNSGRAYVYLGGATGLATTPIWTRDAASAGEWFGYCVAGAGDVDGDGYADVIVGAPSYSDAFDDRGRADVYRGTSTGLSATPAWQLTVEDENTNFGAWVATAGDVNGDGFADVFVGAPTYHVAGIAEGGAFLWYGSGSGPAATHDWDFTCGQEGADLGICVGTAGDVNGDGFSDLLIGADRYTGSFAQEGCAFLYLGGGERPDDGNPGWSDEGDQASAFCGQSVANGGDVNGDGYDDILVGAPYYDNGQANEGVVLLYLGHRTGPTAVPDWFAESNQVEATLGRSVSCAGDVNGDGYDDVIAGAPRYDGSYTNEGKAFVWLGSPTGGPYGNPANAAWSAGGLQDGALFGWSVASAGDVNRDSYGDVIVGAPGYSHGQTHEGGAAVYHGRPAGLLPYASWIMEGDQDEASAGFSVAGAGDVNGDGCSDVLVGLPYYDTSVVNGGRVCLYYGAPSGVSAAYAWTTESSTEGALRGWSVSTGGDTNADGFSDFMVGSPYLESSVSGGAAREYIGSADGPTWNGTVGNMIVGHMVGYAVGTAGDVDADGYSDVLVGVPHGWKIGHEIGSGVVEIWRGGPDGALGGPPREWVLGGDQVDSWFGASVASADVNGDGLSDILVGAPYYDNGQDDEGKAFLFYSSGGPGLPRIPDQWRADLTAPVALGGSGQTDDSFGLKALGRSAAGRQRVRLQYEVEPFRTPFSPGAVVNGAWANTGVPGTQGSVVALSATVTGLSAGGGYHWRLRIASDSPFFPRTPWFCHSGNGSAELDLWTMDPASDVPEVAGLSGGLELDSAPNPARDRTTIRFRLPKATEVALTLYDVQGREVQTLARGPMGEGAHAVNWDRNSNGGSRLAAGVYWLRLRAGKDEQHRKLILIP